MVTFIRARLQVNDAKIAGTVGDGLLLGIGAELRTVTEALGTTAPALSSTLPPTAPSTAV